jgi:DNA-directed RNA polymerase specialized sigma subunit
MNPVDEFIQLKKIASEVLVRPHLRVQDGKSTIVDAHYRTVKSGDKPDGEEEKLRKLRERQEQEVRLWETWNSGGRKKDDLKPLLESFKPMIRSKVSVYKNEVRIPPSAVELEFKLRFVDALKSYNPEKGALGTYIYRYLDKGKRFIVENQNIARIPENRAYKRGQFKAAKVELAEDNGTPPTLKELANHLGWSVAEVDRMDRENRDDYLSTEFLDDPSEIVPSRDEETLRLFKYELAGKERELYEYLTGYGKPHIDSTSELSKILGLKDYQVSRLKASISKKLSKYV